MTSTTSVIDAPRVHLAEPPHHGIEDLEALADTMTRSGLPTRVSVSGQALSLAPAVGRAAYRIVLAALTNALRHADPASAVVSMTDVGRRDLGGRDMSPVPVAARSGRQ